MPKMDCRMFPLIFARREKVGFQELQKIHSSNHLIVAGRTLPQIQVPNGRNVALEQF